MVALLAAGACGADVNLGSDPPAAEAELDPARPRTVGIAFADAWMDGDVERMTEIAGPERAEQAQGLTQPQGLVTCAAHEDGEQFQCDIADEVGVTHHIVLSRSAPSVWEVTSVAEAHD